MVLLLMWEWGYTLINALYKLQIHIIAILAYTHFFDPDSHSSRNTILCLEVVFLRRHRQCLASRCNGFTITTGDAISFESIRVFALFCYVAFKTYYYWVRVNGIWLVMVDLSIIMVPFEWILCILNNIAVTKPSSWELSKTELTED